MNSLAHKPVLKGRITDLGSGLVERHQHVSDHPMPSSATRTSSSMAEVEQIRADGALQIAATHEACPGS
jgi:hypothetical protein